MSVFSGIAEAAGFDSYIMKVKVWEEEYVVHKILS